MDVLKGIAVSPGVVIGRLFLVEEEGYRIVRKTVAPDAVEREIDRLNHALKASADELRLQMTQAEETLGKETAEVFGFHLGMLQDPTLTKPIRQRIREELFTAEYATSVVFEELVERFKAMPTDAFQTKVDDIWDMERRVLRNLMGEHQRNIKTIEEPVVVVSHDLTPSQAAVFSREHVQAFATDAGGRTSHTSIVARALGIPAVVGLGGLTRLARDGMSIIVDGDRGVVVLDPDENTSWEYEQFRARHVALVESLEDVRSLPAVTTDGVRIHLHGNIEFPDEIPHLLANDGEGVGLFRTEFIYLTGNGEPSENEQYNVYRRTLEALQGRPLTIRTFDLGADKYTQAQAREPERNPVLGCRSIRFCLQNLPLFKRQLRAILRVSILGEVRIMFPLICNLQELRQAKMVLSDVMEELESEKIPFNDAIKVGMMVETPAAALMANLFAQESDFFSIGTNDLIQYTLVVDRSNERVANLYTAAQPAVLQLIRIAVRAGRRFETPVSLCGEIAGDAVFTMLLIGLGLRTLSMSPASIPNIKRVIRNVDTNQCDRLARKIGSYDSPPVMLRQLRAALREVAPEALEFEGG
jgi:phosphoenolpyruvate-protein phosphotransferase (PTS system enzyme I)